VANDINDQIVQLAAEVSKLPTEDEHLYAVQAQIVVASQIYGGIAQVCANQNGLAGEALLRTLFEVITSAIILAKSRVRLTEFVRHGRFTRLSLMRHMRTGRFEKRLAQEIAATEEEFQKLRAEFGNERWHKMGTTASFTAAEFAEGTYDSFYRRSSVIAHGQPYVTVWNGKVDARLMVWERLSAGVVMMSDMLMVIFLSTVIREFKLGLNDKIVRLLDEADAATKDHLNNTGRALGMLDEELLP
jgi:Family of unknown function (DUF5677)